MIPKEKANITGIVTSVVFKGVHYEILVKSHNTTWKIHSTKNANIGDEDRLLSLQKVFIL